MVGRNLWLVDYFVMVKVGWLNIRVMMKVWCGNVLCVFMVNVLV